MGLKGASAVARQHDPAALPAADPVLLLAATGPLQPALRGVLRDPAPPAGWRLLDRLIDHRVDGLAWKAIASLPHGEVDPWLRGTLRRRHQQRAAAALAQGLALCEVLERLDRAGVPTAVMRGLRAIEGIYKDAGVRPFEDHDLLIRPEDESGARSILRALGYEEAATGFFRRATVSIDLHVDALPVRRRPRRDRPFPVEVPALFREARAGWVAGGPALLLSPEDEVILQAFHVAKHSFDRLIRTADLAHFIAAEGSGVCWEAVREKAERTRTLRLVTLAVEAAEVLGVTSPPAVRREGPVPWLEALILERLRELRPLPHAGELLMALSVPRLADRLGFLLGALAPRDRVPRPGREEGPPGRAVVLLERHHGS